MEGSLLDVELGLRSTTFELPEQLDERTLAGTAEVRQIMLSEDLDFDAARLRLVQEQMAAMGVDPSGMPLDPKVFTFGGVQGIVVSMEEVLPDVPMDASARCLLKANKQEYDIMLGLTWSTRVSVVRTTTYWLRLLILLMVALALFLALTGASGREGGSVSGGLGMRTPPWHFVEPQSAAADSVLPSWLP